MGSHTKRAQFYYGSKSTTPVPTPTSCCGQKHSFPIETWKRWSTGGPQMSMPRMRRIHSTIERIKKKTMEENHGRKTMEENQGRKTMEENQGRKMLVSKFYVVVSETEKFLKSTSTSGYCCNHEEKMKNMRKVAEYNASNTGDASRDHKNISAFFNKKWTNVRGKTILGDPVPVWY